MTATQDIDSKSPSRRALLAGALGGIGAWIASGIGRASPARAADGDPVLVGSENNSTSVTKLTNNATSDTVLQGDSTSGIGVSGSSSSANGVEGFSTSNRGVYGQSISNSAVYGLGLSASMGAGVGHSANNGTGIFGFSGAFVLPAAKPKTGVYGYAAQDNASQGVWGHSPAGNGVVGSTTTGYAGYFTGKVYSTQFYELSEIGTPAAPAPNRARLFVKDNGAGKTQLCVRFNSGAVQIIATQP